MLSGDGVFLSSLSLQSCLAIFCVEQTNSLFHQIRSILVSVAHYPLFKVELGPAYTGARCMGSVPANESNCVHNTPRGHQITNTKKDHLQQIHRALLIYTKLISDDENSFGGTDSLRANSLVKKIYRPKKQYK